MLPDRLCFASLLLAVALAPQVFAAEPDLRDPSLSDDELIEAIQDQWKDRKASITSFELDMEIEQTQWIDLRKEEAAEQPGRNDLRDPLAGRRPSRKPTRWQLRYYFERGKVAFYRQLLDPGEIDPDATPVEETRMAFDGEQTMKFHSSPLIVRPVAEVNVSRTPHGDFKNMQTLPLYLWRDPSEMFRRGRWKPKEIEVASRQVDVEGTPCIRLALKRRGDGAIPSVGWLDVDPARGAAPVGWQHLQGERPLESIRIEYDGSGPDAVPSSWTHAIGPTGHDQAGSTFYTRVKEAKVNEDVADDRFRISLPEGTLVREKKGKEQREYYVGDAGESQGE
jgi:hypothetical protein